MSLSSKSGNGAGAGGRPAVRSGALPRSRLPGLQSFHCHLAIYCQLYKVTTTAVSSKVNTITRSEGGAGVSGSVLRGAGGEKENRGIRNMDGMVCSFHNFISGPSE